MYKHYPCAALDCFVPRIESDDRGPITNPYGNTGVSEGLYNIYSPSRPYRFILL